MRRLFNVSVSILMVVALCMSQSWVLTAAYADSSIDGLSGPGTQSVEDSAAIQDGSVSGDQKSDVAPENSESHTNRASSEEAGVVAAADSAETNQLTVKNVSVSAHV